MDIAARLTGLTICAVGLKEKESQEGAEPPHYSGAVAVLEEKRKPAKPGNSVRPWSSPTMCSFGACNESIDDCKRTYALQVGGDANDAAPPTTERWVRLTECFF